jgi:hypothetical protein
MREWTGFTSFRMGRSFRSFENVNKLSNYIKIGGFIDRLSDNGLQEGNCCMDLFTPFEDEAHLNVI